MDYGPQYQRRMADDKRKKDSEKEEFKRQEEALFQGMEEDGQPRPAPKALPPIRKESLMNDRQRSIFQKLKQRPKKGKVA